MRRSRLFLAVLLSAGLAAGGCTPATDPVPPVLPTPERERGGAFPGTGNQPLGDTSVPTASSVFTPAAGAEPPPTTGARDNSALTKPEADVAMPQPGQANAHSAPLPADAGSSPRTP